MSFNIGLSGLHASSTDLEVTGNNIANASSVGFKKSRTEFGDVYTTTLLGTGSNPVGSGTYVQNVRQQFTQGNISGTGSVMDMAIDGNGFFVLNENGNVSYTRAGYFNVDKNGYVIANTGARLQGFPANDSGTIGGILGDMRIDVATQPPRLTNQILAQYNLNAGAKVLQEQGKKLESNGLAIGAAHSGIPESTRSTLDSAGQPTSAGSPAQATFATGGITATPAGSAPAGSLAAIASTGIGAPITFTVNLNDGKGTQTVTIPPLAAGGTEANALRHIQQALNDGLGSRELIAGNDGGRLSFTRGGYHSTDGSGFTLSNGLDGLAGAPASYSPAGIPGSQLFVGSNPTTADFRSQPGSQTTNRTTSTPPLNIVGYTAGSRAELTGTTYPGAGLDFSGTNSLSFNISLNGNPTPITLDNATMGGNAAADINAVITEINAQLTAAGVPATSLIAQDDGSGAIQFISGNDGDSISLTQTGSSARTLNELGFAAGNRNATGQLEVFANNEFNLQVLSNTGNASNAVQITIPPSNYANLDALAEAIQAQIDSSTGSNGLAGKVSVKAVGGQLVFTNTNVGQNESLAFSDTGNPNAAGALTALKFDNMFEVAGTNKVDKSNSFSINLTVPAPDPDNRSGSVQITLDEEYRSVQQLAASINRQLNAQSADDYIGVQAYAVEIEPKVVPPQFKLQLRATQEGEGSVVSVSNVMANGPDITDAEIFGLLQLDPSNNGLFTAGIEGVSNMYPEQKVTITDPKGNETELTIPARSEANEIVAKFNLQPGITATAETIATIPLNSFNSPSRNMTINVNGQNISGRSLKDIADEINSYSNTTLPGTKATIAENGDLVITNQVGRDIKITMSSPTVTDSLVVIGNADSGPVMLGGTAGADHSAAVGGKITFILNEGYSMSKPEPQVSGIFGSLTPEEFEDYTLNTFDPDNQDTYNDATTIMIYDSLGNPHEMTQYFVREPLDPDRPNERNVWAMYILIDGQEVGDPDPTLPFPENLEPSRFRKEIFFNQDGSMNTAATGPLYITNWTPLDSQGNPNGAFGPVNELNGGLPLREPATNSNFEVKLDGTTQHAGGFDINDQKQNGYSTGRLKSLDIDSEGVVFARFTNGQAQVLGQVALANFRNPEGLTPLGDTAWAESFESGNATIGAPRTATFGRIKSSALEDSNVDLSDQLVRLIIAQRNFQANAKTIETTNQITQTILNI